MKQVQFSLHLALRGDRVGVSEGFGSPQCRYFTNVAQSAKRHRMAFVLAAAGLAFALLGAAEPSNPSNKAEAPPEVEAILSTPAEPSDYAAEERCVPIRNIREVKALDDRHVTFRVGRNDLYLVQFKHRCPSLRRNDPVAYESLNGISLCRQDFIRGFTRFGMGEGRLGPPCSIPGFQQISEEQLAMLRAALRKR